MKHINLSQLLAASLITLSASSIAFAQPPAQSVDNAKLSGHSAAQCKAKHAEMRQRFAKELGLNADQQKKIEALRSSFKSAHKAEFEAKHQQYKELKALKQSGASQAQIDAKRDAIHQQFAGMKADREKLEQQIKAVLTPDQVQKFDAMKARHHKHWEEKHAQHDQKQ